MNVMVNMFYHMTSRLGVPQNLCNKIDTPLVVYRFSGNVMTPIITLRKRWQNLDVFTQKKIDFN